MVNRVSNFANAYRTRLTASVGALDTTFNVESTVGAPSSPCYIVIDPKSDSSREVIFCDGTFTGTTLTTTAIANRFLAGSAAASGLTHTVGDILVVVPVAQMFEDLHDRVTLHTHAYDTLDFLETQTAFDNNIVLTTSTQDLAQASLTIPSDWNTWTGYASISFVTFGGALTDRVSYRMVVDGWGGIQHPGVAACAYDGSGVNEWPLTHSARFLKTGLTSTGVVTAELSINEWGSGMAVTAGQATTYFSARRTS